MIDGESVDILVDDNKWGEYECNDVYNHPKPVEGTVGANHTFLLYSRS